MILNNNEIAAVKDCLKRYIEFNNNGLMSSYKEKHRLNVHKKLLLELNRVVDK